MAEFEEKGLNVRFLVPKHKIPDDTEILEIAVNDETDFSLLVQKDKANRFFLPIMLETSGKLEPSKKKSPGTKKIAEEGQTIIRDKIANKYMYKMKEDGYIYFYMVSTKSHYKLVHYSETGKYEVELRYALLGFRTPKTVQILSRMKC